MLYPDTIKNSSCNIEIFPAIVNAFLDIVYAQKNEWRWKLVTSIRDYAFLFQLKHVAVHNINLQRRMLNVIDAILMQCLTFAIQAIMVLNWYDFGQDINSVLSGSLGQDKIPVAGATVCFYPASINYVS